jgi:hypothetical protein
MELRGTRYSATKPVVSNQFLVFSFWFLVFGFDFSFRSYAEENFFGVQEGHVGWDTRAVPDQVKHGQVTERP